VNPRPSKIVCVGRNYVEHARELGNDVPERPLIFLKPPSSLIEDGQPIRLPPQSAQVEHEGEIGIVVGHRARDVAEEDALDYIAGYVPINDVTARDLQRIDGQWTRAKGFDTFCPVGPMVTAQGIDWTSLRVECRVNGELRQAGEATEMAFGIPHIFSFISHIMTLEPGDLIATGTPAGISRIEPGDVVEVELCGHSHVRNPVTRSGEKGA
jgi:2-keto-4-pentenoate hydratase/2-oxohepta-3-ene-1,7-dioic acid hydratase in catechol pathway